METSKCGTWPGLRNTQLPRAQCPNLGSAFLRGSRRRDGPWQSNKQKTQEGAEGCRGPRGAGGSRLCHRQLPARLGKSRWQSAGLGPTQAHYDRKPRLARFRRTRTGLFGKTARLGHRGPRQDDNMEGLAHLEATKSLTLLLAHRGGRLPRRWTAHVLGGRKRLYQDMGDG